MDKIVIKVPTSQTGNAEVGVPEKGFVTYVDEAGKEHTVAFDTTTARAAGDITIDLGSQVAVKKISIAKGVHDRLEDYYIRATDFSVIEEMTEKLFKEIF